MLQELPNYKRKEILLYCAAEIQRRQDELLHSLCVVRSTLAKGFRPVVRCGAPLCSPGSSPYHVQEAGKPLKDARAELGRAYDTFTIAAEEAIRQYGEVLPLDVSVR